MSLTGRLRGRRLARALAAARAFYEREWTPQGIREWQLAALNRLWSGLLQDSGYYAELAGRHDLPPAFASLGEFRRMVPVLERGTLRAHREAMVCGGARPQYWRVTGGSTAEPLRLPARRSEDRDAEGELWYGRAAWGVRPADRLWLLWGHSHLLGAGLRGRLERGRRQLKDRLLGYRRCSAYALGEAALREAARGLLEFRPRWVLGYAVALDRFARVNADQRHRFHALGLKVAMATGESFPDADSRARIAAVLGCPVAMEYGAVETGPIAQEFPDGELHVYWRRHLLDGLPWAQRPEAREVLVTCLAPRLLPLVRYRLGDLVAGDPQAPGFAQRLHAVVGRCNDVLELGGGARVHSEAFSHVVRGFEVIAGYQVEQRRDGAITLRYVAARDLSPAEGARVRARLARVHPALAGVRIERVPRLEPTVAGKTRRIYRVAGTAAGEGG